MSNLHKASDQYDAVVIGGGCNGLTCAALLAKAGRKVVVLERREILGGLAASEEFDPNFRSAGLLLDTSRIRPSVVQALELERHGLSLALDPHTFFTPQLDGPGLSLALESNQAEQEIRAHSSRDAERFHEYCAFFSKVGGVIADLADAALPNPTVDGFANLFDLASSAFALRRLGKNAMLELLRVPPMAVADWLDEWFECDVLKGTLALPALMGAFAGPRSPSTAANLLFQQSLAGKAVIGGAAALVDALGRAAKRHGVEIRTASEVVEITLDSNGVRGITLSNGETISAEIVAASCDPKTTFLKLIEQQALSNRFRQRIEKLRTAGTAAQVNLALSAPLRFSCRPDERVEFARICPSLDYIEKAFDAAKYGDFSKSPALDVHVSTVSRPQDAPAGHAVVSVLVPFIPYEPKVGWSNEARNELGRAVVQSLARFVPNLESQIVAQEVLTPVDFERRYGVIGGHLYHADHALDQLLARPSPECAQYETPVSGLYLCGSGSWPGGGLTCAPGANAAREILKRRRN